MHDPRDLFLTEYRNVFREDPYKAFSDAHYLATLNASSGIYSVRRRWSYPPPLNKRTAKVVKRAQRKRQGKARSITKGKRK